MSTILEQIFSAKRIRVAEQKRVHDPVSVRESAIRSRSASAALRFRSALFDQSSINIIAEFKKASPSKGTIRNDADSATFGALYQESGAKAISVLTEEDYFQGSLEDLVAIRDAASLPILRKDFTFDEFQIAEAAAAGAAAILLIVASLSKQELGDLIAFAEGELGIDALVEVHTKDEMLIAKDVGATLIGVNNRDLRDFTVSLDRSRELIDHAPPDAVLVAESGITSRADIDELRKIGYSGFLIGETLMRSPDPGAALRELCEIR
jgi:indole-3-glycerol phosphate synthase